MRRPRLADATDTGAIAAREAAERVARQSYGRLLALLAARTRDLAGAEDALADAFARALVQWPSGGVPDNPEAWLLTVARRRQLDMLRRAGTRKAGTAHLRLLGEEMEAAMHTTSAIPDNRLTLMFACAHPAIERGMRAPLILQTVLGLTAGEIAAAFLVPAPTMGQRLTRAKTRIRDAGIPFRVPDRADLPERLDAVLDAIYAIHAKGWDELEPAPQGDADLANEAIWLGQLVVELIPEAPEAKGMLALMLYTRSRRDARRNAAGAFVPLDRQDTRLWDLAMIDRAEDMLHAANASGPTGRYQLEAAIQSAHVAQILTGIDNRKAIASLYDALHALTRSPVVALNRAIARAETDGPEAALVEIEALATDRRMSDYQPYWAARAHLAALAGDEAEAEQAYSRAIELSTDGAVRDYLVARRRRLARH